MACHKVGHEFYSVVHFFADQEADGGFGLGVGEVGEEVKVAGQGFGAVAARGEHQQILVVDASCGLVVGVEVLHHDHRAAVVGVGRGLRLCLRRLLLLSERGTRPAHLAELLGGQTMDANDAAELLFDELGEAEAGHGEDGELEEGAEQPEAG